MEEPRDGADDAERVEDDLYGQEHRIFERESKEIARENLQLHHGRLRYAA